MEFYPDLNEQSASRRYSLTRQANTLPERVMGGDGGGGGGIKMGLFLHTTKFNFLSDV